MSAVSRSIVSVVDDDDDDDDDDDNNSGTRNLIPRREGAMARARTSTTGEG